MYDFYVKPKFLRKESEKIKETSRFLVKDYRRVSQISSQISSMSEAYGGVSAALDEIASQLDNESESVKKMGVSLNSISHAYTNAERRIMCSAFQDLSNDDVFGGSDVEPDDQYEKDVQAILDILSGKNGEIAAWTYLYALLNEANFMMPRQCNLTKAQKEALLRFFGENHFNKLGADGIERTKKLEKYFEENAERFNSPGFNLGERMAVAGMSLPLAYLLGFSYNPKTDSYYTKEGCIQQQWGFCDAIDKWGPALGMDLDTEIVTFHSDGYEFRAQFWKGTYMGGAATGSEFALYCRPDAEAKANPYVCGSENSKYILFDAVDKEYQPKIQQTSTYSDNDGTVIAFKCNTGDYGDGDDYWNLNIRTEAGIDKDDVKAYYRIDCSDQGSEFEEAMFKSIQENPHLSDKARKEGDSIVLSY